MKPIARGGLTLRVLGTGTTLALIVGVSFAVLLRAIFAQRDTARLAVHSQEVLASANRLERLVVDLETGPRGYLLTGQERFLGPWITARVAAPNEAANLRRLAQVPEQRQLAERIDQLVGSYITDYSDPLVAA
ncbi:MAG TPA: CHASE3 domain-containing protein, partial [Pseudonocardiaceae bacterium]|nr:CHASE3 domain-containing protein [Pseudonocardiaceae bacterium]